MSATERASGLAPWLKQFIRQIGLAALWNGAEATEQDSNLLDALTDDVFAYMGRPVQQHLPVFSRAEMRQMYEEALLG